MARAFIGVGSNVDPEHNVPAALRALRRAARITGVSTFHLTEPVDHAPGPPFVDGVVALETALSPRALKWEVLRPIEAALGRLRGPDPNAPRTIDLDLLLHEGAASGSEPSWPADANITERAFLAWPLCELDPELVLPDGRSIREVAEGLPREAMAPLPRLTERLRAEARHE